MTDRKKILVIDDAMPFLYILNHILGGEFEVIYANNGEEGLKTAKAVIPDLILSDLLMPGISGYDVLKALKADEEMQHIPVVLITGSDAEEDKVKGYELGASGYITKPFKQDVVKNTIDGILR